MLESGVVNSTAGAEPTYRATIEMTVGATAPWGLIYSTEMTLTARGRVAPQTPPTEGSYTIALTGQIYGDLQPRPSALMNLNGLRTGQDFERAVTLERASGVPFTISGAQVTRSSIRGVNVRVELVAC